MGAASVRDNTYTDPLVVTTIQNWKAWNLTIYKK
jgi:hypothetical protein